MPIFLLNPLHCVLKHLFNLIYFIYAPISQDFVIEKCYKFSSMLSNQIV